MSQYSNADFWNRNKTRGAITVAAVATIVVAYRIRHARRRPQLDLSGKVSKVAKDVVGDDPLEAGREFLVATVIPEFKPALLTILKDFEEVVEDAFTRAEQAVKKL
jgi:hypothetical protein